MNNYLARAQRGRSLLAAFAAACAVSAALTAAPASAQTACAEQGCASATPYANMPKIAPIGVRTEKYMDIPESGKGPAIDPAKGYRIEVVGRDMYMVSDGAYQSMFVVYDKGVVVIDAPPALAAFIPKAIAETTSKPVTHLIYSHAHADHIGAAKTIGGAPVIIAQAETKKLLQRANDPNRPLPTKTFDKRYTLRLGKQVLELSYGGDAHEPGNILIYAPEQKVLMVVDVIFPGWMPFRRLAVAHDIPGVIQQVKGIEKMDFKVLVGGHLARTGTKADVTLQREFNDDLQAAAGKALQTTQPGQELNPLDAGNPWAVFDNYVDRVTLQCVNTLTPKWASKLAGFDAFIWDQCMAMENSIRID